MKLEKVKMLIASKQNPKRKAFNEMLDPSINKVYGLTIPELRNLSKEIYQDDPISFLETNDFESYELKQLQAMVIGHLKDINVALKYFIKFIPEVDSWSVNDTLCMDFKIARKHLELVLDALKPFVKSNKEFEQRVVAVMLLCHYLEDDYIDQVIDILSALKIDAYYAKMGVAWAFATILAKYPDKGLKFMEIGNLDPWTYRKTIQKAIESFRVSDKLKDILRSFR